VNQVRKISGDCYEMPDGTIIGNVHSPTQCFGRPCVIHNPSDHHMTDWQLHWRDDRGIFERICPHGVGHPDPDQFDFWRDNDRMAEAVHGCDGCCKEPIDSLSQDVHNEGR
jgi:hypothetical protein